MNYLILNGKRSTDYTGLLISSLPPVSKPMMRTSIEQIDGRDGDVVTKLGYAAYDKTVEIGLFGRFDVDRVIRYFDSEGTVVFSNEVDKYYRYQILQEISFERLIRFRKASVVFHVQPYKYSAVQRTLTFEPDGETSMTVTNTGNVGAPPVITVYGTGDAVLFLNGTLVMTMALGEGPYITVDAEALNAYAGDVLKNRSVTGDYRKLSLDPGPNTVSWTGDVTKIEISRYSRWI